MASELRVNTLKDASGNNSIATSFVAGGSAKAWFDKSADGTSLLDSFNISSLDDDGTGDYGLHYTSNLSSTNYAISLGVDDNTSNGNINSDVSNGTRTAGSVDMEAYYDAGSTRTLYDTRTHGSIHGDLA